LSRLVLNQENVLVGEVESFVVPMTEKNIVMRCAESNLNPSEYKLSY